MLLFECFPVRQICCLGQKKCLEVKSEEVQGRLLSERKGKVIPCRGAEAKKGTRTDSAGKKSGTENLETESIGYEKKSGEYGKVCKVEDSHKDKRA